MHSMNALRHTLIIWKLSQSRFNMQTDTDICLEVSKLSSFHLNSEVICNPQKMFQCNLFRYPAQSSLWAESWLRFRHFWNTKLIVSKSKLCGNLELNWKELWLSARMGEWFWRMSDKKAFREWVHQTLSYYNLLYTCWHILYRWRHPQRISFYCWRQKLYRAFP